MSEFVVRSHYAGCDDYLTYHRSLQAARQTARQMHFNGALEITICEQRDGRTRAGYALRDGGAKLVELAVGHDIAMIASPRSRPSALAERTIVVH